jgi:PAS domain S-box-containing protein
MIEGISDIAAVYDLQGTILYESAAGVRHVLGYKLDERLGHNVFEFIHPDDHTPALEAIRAGFQDPESVNRVEMRVRNSDGRWRWLETQGHVEEDEDGGHVIVAVSRDVTESKLTRDALAERDARLQLLNTIARELIAGKPANEIIALTIGHISRNHPDLRAAYATLDESGTFTVTHSTERPGFPSVAGLSADASSAPAALQSLRDGEVLRVENVSEDERLAPVAEELAETGTVALLNVPLRHSRRLLGLLCFNSEQPRVWSEHEESTLKEVAGMLSIALREAQHVELRRMAEKNLRRATKDLGAIFEAFPELGAAGAASNGPEAAPRRPAVAPSQRPAPKPEHNLSLRDLNVLELVAEGLTNKEIGVRLSLSPYTVKDHMKALMRKLGAKNRVEAVVIATKRGFV